MLQYYFYINIDGIDLSKEYKIIIENTNKLNQNLTKTKEAYNQYLEPKIKKYLNN